MAGNSVALIMNISARSLNCLRILVCAGLAATGAACRQARAREGWARHVIDRSSQGADGVRLGDLNRDGLPDIATGWEEGGRVRVCLNPGPAKAREPWPAVTVGKVPNVEDALLVDLDGDGRQDVASCAEGRTRAMFAHWAPRSPKRLLDPKAWRTEAIPASRGKMMWMFAAPIRAEGKRGADLIAGGKGPGAALGRWRLPERARNPAAWHWRALRPVGWLMSLVIEDMNGDGRQDVLFSDRKGPRRGCFWLEQPGADAPEAPWREHPVGGEGLEAMFLSTADLDQDGLEDVVAAAKPRLILFCRRLDASGDKWRVFPIRMPEEAGTAKAVAAGDMNNDGRLDLVFTTEQASHGRQGVMWLSYRESPFRPDWQPHAVSGVDGVKHDLVELIDLDNDGDLDVLTCEEARNLGVFWYENPLLEPRD